MADLELPIETHVLQAFVTEGLKPVLAFAHYTAGPPGEDEIRRRFARTHDDVLFERAL